MSHTQSPAPYDNASINPRPMPRETLGDRYTRHIRNAVVVIAVTMVFTVVMTIIGGLLIANAISENNANNTSCIATIENC